MEAVSHIAAADNGFVLTAGDRELSCKSIILATACDIVRSGLSGRAIWPVRGVSYCAVCDGAFYKGEDVAVVGGGNTAVEDALFLSSYCNRVLLVHRRGEFRAERRLVERACSKDNIELVLDTVVDALEGEDALTGVRLRSRDGTISRRFVTGLFVAVGQIPQNEPFGGLVSLNDAGYIAAGRIVRPPVPACSPRGIAAPNRFGNCPPPRPTGR